ncbi:hypothetical protein ABH991_001516 [Bradyrhizobium ottawaense]
MKGRDGDRRNRFGSNLDVIRQSQRNDLERRRSLLTRAPTEPPAAIQAQSATPTAIPVLPALRLYHRSDLNSEVNYVSAAHAAVSTVADAVIKRKSGVIFTWPDRINRPLGVTISALLRAQSARPTLRCTVAYYPFSDRKTHSLKSIFVDEEDLAARYLETIRAMDRSQYSGPDYQNAYLLKGLREASAAGGSAKISHPNLRELIPTFAPIEHNHTIRYADRDEDFLGDIASRRTLIKEASKYRREISSKDVAPIAILGLPPVGRRHQSPLQGRFPAGRPMRPDRRGRDRRRVRPGRFLAQRPASSRASRPQRRAVGAHRGHHAGRRHRQDGLRNHRVGRRRRPCAAQTHWRAQRSQDRPQRFHDAIGGLRNVECGLVHGPPEG